MIKNHLLDVCIRFTNNRKKGWSPNIKTEAGRKITCKYFIFVCMLIYIQLWFTANKKNNNSQVVLEDTKYTWKRISVPLHSQIPQYYFHQFEQMQG